MRKLLAVIAILSFFGMMERSVFAEDTATEIASLQAQIERLKSMVSNKLMAVVAPSTGKTPATTPKVMEKAILSGGIPPSGTSLKGTRYLFLTDPKNLRISIHRCFYLTYILSQRYKELVFY